MAGCIYLEQCPFFQDVLPSMPASSESIKRIFCQNDYEQCARYQVREKLGLEHVPRDLFPNDGAKAAKIMQSPG
jgi:hypothetical protein